VTPSTETWYISESRSQSSMHDRKARQKRAFQQATMYAPKGITRHYCGDLNHVFILIPDRSCRLWMDEVLEKGHVHSSGWIHIPPDQVAKVNDRQISHNKRVTTSISVVYNELSSGWFRETFLTHGNACSGVNYVQFQLQYLALMERRKEDTQLKMQDPSPNFRIL
jgi:hypothetical protein